MNSQPQANRPADQSHILIVSLDLGSHLGGGVPSVLLERARRKLQEQMEGGELCGVWVQGFGEDLHLHLSSSSTDSSQLSHLRQTALEVGVDALQEAIREKLCSEQAEGILAAAPEEQAEALRMRFVEFPYTERGAEPIFVTKAINASWGFFNRALFNLFFNPDKGSGRRIEGNDFLAVVESIEDLMEGKQEVRTFEFGPGNINELVALVADAELWRLSRVYAVRGKFGTGELKDEPAAVVEGSFNPVMIGRSQSGLPAIGEYTQAAAEFYFGPGGSQGSYRVGLVPATFDQAALPVSDGVCKVVAYAYQSYGGGRIPEGPDVVDIFSQNRPETYRVQQEASRLIKHMVGHGEFEPYLNPRTAEHRASQQAEQLGRRLEEIPDGMDPLVEAANQRSQFTLSDIKADAGGKIGHTTPPNHYRGIAEASLQEAKDQGLIFATSAYVEVGDDEHLLMSHQRGADSNDIHLFAHRTFFRQIWVAGVLGYKWYGLGQDLVGEASEGRTTEELANLTDDFIDLLPEYLPPVERERMDDLRQAYQEWKSDKGEGHKVAPAFSGNVSGQGPGFAELPLRRPESVGLLAIDKAGPSAFNLPIWWSLNQAVADGSLLEYLEGVEGKGAILEIWDVEGHRRVFLDFESEGRVARDLLGAIEKFNVKRIWTRNSEEWEPSRLKESLGDVLLAASTEKLAVITGGEYRGKDDPVLLAVEPLARALNLFMRDRFYLTQGDGRGSHFMFPTPLPFEDAIATINSRGVVVSAWVTFDASGEIRKFDDVFADPAYESARDRAYSVNKAIWDAQGGNFVPVGVGADKVEQSYPLAKTLASITTGDSEFVSQRRNQRRA